MSLHDYYDYDIDDCESCMYINNCRKQCEDYG